MICSSECSESNKLNVRRCLPKYTYIHTNKGLIRIDEIKIGDSVQTLNGYKKVLNVFKQGKQKLLRIYFSNNRWLDCTENHRFAILSSLEGEIDWLEAKYLNSDDTIFINQNPIEGSGINSVEWAYFYGVLNGDGNISDRRNQGCGLTISIALSNDITGQGISEKLVHFLSNEGYSPKIAEYNVNYKYIRIYNNELALSCLNYKIPKKSPVIPSEIFKGSIEAKCSYLAGLCDADGTPSKYNLCSSSYLDFLINVQRIATSLGIDTYISTRKDRNGGKYKLENCLIIRGFVARKRVCKYINPFMVKQFPEKYNAKFDSSIPIKFAIGAKENLNIGSYLYNSMTRRKNGIGNPIHKQLIDYCPDFWTKVYPAQITESVELDYEEETYDIEVEDEHSFFAEGILVHNSAELAKGNIKDKVFLDIKNYDKYPYRAPIGWMSNNSCFLEDDEDFERLGEIAERVKTSGDPGIANLRNMKLARVGKSMDGLRPDVADGFNPCGEIPLENKELCCLAQTLPTRCDNEKSWYKAAEYATVYASTVQLLATHQPETNAVIARNRRIGVSLIDYTGWKHDYGLNKVIKFMREGYNIIRKVNRWVNDEAGVPPGIRVTTIQPGGTTPKIAGKTSGASYPNFIHMIRRVRVGQNSEVYRLLHEANIPHEPDVVSANTEVFEWPIKMGPAKASHEVTIWEQAFNVITLQREWADNSVSNTLNFRPKWVLVEDHINLTKEKIYDIFDKYFGYQTYENIKKMKSTEMEFITKNKVNKVVLIRNKENNFITEIRIYEYNPKHEEDDIESVLSAIAPLTKSISLLPQTAKGVYKQMPEEGITEEEYHKRLSVIKKIDWTRLTELQQEPEKYCEGDRCVR